MRAIALNITGIFIFLLIWLLGSVLMNKDLILPSPIVVFQVLGKLFLAAATWIAAIHTLWKVALSLLLVLIIGITLGLILGSLRVLHEMTRPIVLVVQAVPVISWLSIVIFTWGISWQGPVFITFFTLLPTAILTTIAGVHSLDRNLLEMARVYRVKPYKTLRYIYLGSLFPFIIAILEICIGQAWKVVLVSEFLVGDNGLGVQIAWARQLFNIPGVYAYTLCGVILGLLTERSLKVLLERFSKRWKVV